MDNIDPTLRAQWIEAVYASDGWQHVFQPLLEEKRRATMTALRNPDLARKAKVPDDYIRGVLDTVEWIMTAPATEAVTTRNAAAEEEMYAQRDREDSERATLGFGGGMIGM